MDQVLISGYYGFKNSGDDALLLSIIEDLKKQKPDLNIVVLSSNPKETSAVYGVKSINRYNPFSVIGAMLSSDMLISGGGTLIQDGTSTKSLFYYLSVISLAHFFRLKIMLYSNGIGPLSRGKNIERTRKVLNKVDLITLRDQSSYDELSRIGVDKPDVVLTADPAFTLAASSEQAAKDVLSQYGVDFSKPLLCISVRDWNMVKDDFEDVIADAVSYAANQYGFYPVFLPMQPSKDVEISKRIAKKLSCPASVIEKAYSNALTLGMIRYMSLCIGMRLHSLIYSASQCVPLIGLVYDPKINGCMDYMGQNLYYDVELLSKGDLEHSIDTVMNDYDGVRETLRTRVASLQKKAQLNATYAVSLLEKKETGVQSSGTSK